MKTLLCFMLMTLPLSADDFTVPSINSAKSAAAAPAASAAARVTAPAVKEWTIMAFMNGKNSLSEAVADDMNEMETVGSTAKINVVAEAGTVSGEEGQNQTFSVSRYLVQKDNDIKTVGSKPLITLGKTDMGSWKHLAEFIAWAKTNYPAKHYMLVLWNHGSGWKSPGKPITGDSERGISFDDETGNHITAIELARALTKTGRNDIIASDACLMQDIAANYEIRKYTDIMAGSEESEPNEGQDYSAFLPKLAARPGASAEEVAVMYVSAYHSFYKTKNTNTTISAVRASSLDGVAVRMSSLADALLAGDIQFARDSRRKTLKFADSDARDLGYFAKVTADGTKDPKVRAAAENLYNYIQSSVVISSEYTKEINSASGTEQNRTPGQNGEPASAGDFSNATGLAAYIPVVYQADFEYDKLSFAKACPSWTALVKKMTSPNDAPDYWDDYAHGE